MLNDLLNAFRQWLRTPVVTAVALASLGLGIGANLALFGLVDAVLLRSLPIRDPQSLVRFAWDDTRFGPINVTLSTPSWTDIRDQHSFVDSLLVVANDRVNLSRGGEARYVHSLMISGGGLDALGVEPVVGRTLQPSDDRSDSPPAALISHGLWQRDYAGRADVLQQTVWVNNQAFAIVGVAPASFFGLEVGRGADVIVPIAADALLRTSPRRPDMSWLTLYGRLKPGQTVDQATALLRASPARDALRPAAPPMVVGAGADETTQQAFAPYAISGAQGISTLRRQYEQPLLVLLSSVALVLLIACANLAALVLARFADRRQEIGVRLALGAGRGRIVRMLVAESLLLSLAGALVGIWFAKVTMGALIPYVSAANGMQAQVDVAIDARLAAYAALLAIVSGTLAGLLPAWRASKVSPQVSLAASARGGLHGRRAARSMRVMVAGQVALSLILVAGAAVMVRSFITLTTNTAGVEPDRVLVAIVGGGLSGPDTATRFEWIDRIRRSLAAVPGAEAVSGGAVTPFSGALSIAQIDVPGTIYKGGGDGAVFINGGASEMSVVNRVLPNYFRVMGTPLAAGRDFEDRDGPSTAPIAVVSQAFATKHFGAANPMGRTLTVDGKTLEIVGVLAESRQLNLKQKSDTPVAFGLLTQLSTTGRISAFRFAIRARDPQSLRAAAASAIRDVDPRLTSEFRTMRDEADASINRERLMASLASMFAVLGLAMAVIGLYGTFSYAVARRRGEIGVRMALGAARRDILQMVMREAGIVLAIGTAIGLAGVLASSRLLQNLLFSTSARDPWMLTLALTGVVGAAVLASLVPARRASKIDPMVALREE